MEEGPEKDKGTTMNAISETSWVHAVDTISSYDATKDKYFYHLYFKIIQIKKKNVSFSKIKGK